MASFSGLTITFFTTSLRESGQEGIALPQSLYESRQRHIFGIIYEISIRVLLACTFPEAYIIRDGYERSQERVVVAGASSISSPRSDFL